MSLLAATQIPKPADEQAFERASVVLWRGLLNDKSVQRNGRRGQRQNGVDLFGIRDSDAKWHVGIQCKLKSAGHVLTEKEVRDEIRKARTFRPALKEYYITTTASDDVAMQELAREITAALAASGESLRVFIWGWNTLEERIAEDPCARKAFDPTYVSFSEEILNETRALSVAHSESDAKMGVFFSRMEAMFTEGRSRSTVAPGAATVNVSDLEAHLDAEIDNYRQINYDGKTLTALPLLEGLLERVRDTASGRVLFRIKASIGHCLMALGKDEEAAEMLLAAYGHAPSEPKAVANKALGMLLKKEWKELLSFGHTQLKVDPTNQWLASYMVQAARSDPSMSDPLSVIPEELHQTAAVQIGIVDFTRWRGNPGDWWAAARMLGEAHASEPQALRLVAEAELEEILTTGSFGRDGVLAPRERARLESATATLLSQWVRERKTDGALRPEGAALCVNVIVGLFTLGELPKALDVARQGLSLSPDDVSLMTRAAVVAFEAGDESLTRDLIRKLPSSPEATVLKVRFYSSRGDWIEVVRSVEENASVIPEAEAAVISTVGKLAAIKIGVLGERDRRQQFSAVAAEAADEPRASIVVADFALWEGFEDIADRAFSAAVNRARDDAHAADRFMIAYHASRREAHSIVADMLDGYVAEDRDSDDLRMLARAFVNDNPIRKRAIAFFRRLPPSVRGLSFFQYAEGVLHLNRGALSEAETALRSAIAIRPELASYIALFSVLHRLDRADDMKAIVDAIDLATVEGTPAQKMFLAQIMRKVGAGAKALQYGYAVLKSARNDQQVALRFFGLIMMHPEEDLIPPAESVAVDTWVRLESDQHETHAFLIEEGEDRPAEDILSPVHPTAMAAIGRKIGDEFAMPTGLNGLRRWRIAEIKHKYLHALHDVMENFEKRFPEAKGFHRIATAAGDIQPVLDQVRRVSESGRKVADLYLQTNFPISIVASRRGENAIRFAEYIRALGFDIRTCNGDEAERLGAQELIDQRRHGGAVLDTYTAWTAATMDSLEILQTVFGKVIVPQSLVDDLRALRDAYEFTAEPSMTIGLQDGEFVRHVHTAEELSVRRSFVIEQLLRINAACEVQPVVAPDNPSKLASLIHQYFGSHVLDPANLAGSQHILVSEDMYFRQYSYAACSANGVWLQPVFSFAKEIGLIDHARYVDLVIGLAWRRHGHLSLDVETLVTAFRTNREEGLANFEVLCNFIGTRDAELKSHIEVSVGCLNRLWSTQGSGDLACMRATSIVLENMVRYRGDDWSIVLMLIKRKCGLDVQRYIEGWITGHFLPARDIASAESQIEQMARCSEGNRLNRSDRGRSERKGAH